MSLGDTHHLSKSAKGLAEATLNLPHAARRRSRETTRWRQSKPRSYTWPLKACSSIGTNLSEALGIVHGKDVTISSNELRTLAASTRVEDYQ